MDELKNALESRRDQSDAFPREAFRVIRAHKEEALPYLRTAVDRAIQAQMDLPEDEQLHFYAMFLLGEFKDRTSFRRIVEMVSLPMDIVDFLVGDATTAGLSEILYHTYDGNLVLLEKSVSDEDIDEYVRSAMVDVLGQLYLDGTLSEDAWKQFLRDRAYDRRPEDLVFAKIGEMICSCHFFDLLPELREMYEKGLIDEEFLDGYDYSVDRLFDYSNERDFCQRSFDAEATLSSWAMFSENSEMDDAAFEKTLRQLEREINRPVKKEKIGRNDPCRCGSGKKYKNCCMNKPKSPLDEIESSQERKKWLRDYPYLGAERVPGRLYLADLFDQESIELDQILYLALMNRPGPIWEKDLNAEDMRTCAYLMLAYQKAREMAEREGLSSFEAFDKRHSIHYFAEKWTNRLLVMLSEHGDYALYDEVRDWVRSMRKRSVEEVMRV